MTELILFAFCDDNWRISEGWRDLWELIGSKDFSNALRTLKLYFGDHTIWCPAEFTTEFRMGGLDVQRYDAGSYPSSGVVIVNGDEFIKMIHRDVSEVILCKTIEHETKTEKKFRFSGIKPLDIVTSVGLGITGGLVKEFKEFKLFIHVWNRNERRSRNRGGNSSDGSGRELTI